MTEAQIYSGLLESHGIENRIGGAQHYTTIVLGGSGGDFYIYVDEGDVQSAKGYLDEARKNSLEFSVPYSTNYFKKAVMLGFFGLLSVPFIFNYYSLKAWKNYLSSEDTKKQKAFWSVFILGINLVGLVIGSVALWGLLKHYLQII